MSCVGRLGVHTGRRRLLEWTVWPPPQKAIKSPPRSSKQALPPADRGTSADRHAFAEGLKTLAIRDAAGS
ncbi:MAG TPA: hypothetical protein VFW09_12510 [Solirubrobacteraceae bacterium]|nr:hypothetical protein [Solirubrobacteraceae bacterium]